MNDRGHGESDVQRLRAEREAMRSRLFRALQGVDGWLEPETAWAFHEVARTLVTNGDEPCIVEIGTWVGRTTISLGLGLKARGEGRVFGIDPHTGSDQTIHERGLVDTYPTFVANLEAAGVHDIVIPVRATSHEARSTWNGRRIHGLFVDASRETEDVVEYLNDWLPLLGRHAVLAFRDPFDIHPALSHRVYPGRDGFRDPMLLLDSEGEVLLLDFGREHRPTARERWDRLRLELNRSLYRLSRLDVVIGGRVEVMLERLRCVVGPAARLPAG